MNERFLKYVSIAAAVFLIFAAGLAAGHFRLPPQPLLAKVDATVRDMIRNREAYYFGKPSGQLGPLGFEETGMVVSGHPAAQPGVTLLVGLFGDRLGARLYDNDGALVHEWPVDFFTVAPETMKYPSHAFLHGAWLYPDGDLLVNLDHRRLYRVGACGEIRWFNKAGPHHSIDVDDEGFLWAPTNRFKAAYNDPRLFEDEVFVDRIGRFDPDTGEQVLEIDLVEALVDAEMQGVAMFRRIQTSDLLHLNDVEVLSARDAPAFPMFETGDIMLSLRHSNQIWVLDGESHAIKWWQTGPMLGQHDPDFQPDGTITLYDNRPSAEPSPENGYLGSMGGSRILRIDPATHAYETILQSSGDLAFHSPFRGKHQVLENGNILVAETDRGRAFEITPSGEIVWSFVNAYDEDEVGWITGAYRYPESYGAFAAEGCGDGG